jgi:hypothetical protein
MTITKQEADTIYRLARALEDTGRLCSLSESDDRLEWRKKNQVTQCALQEVLKQLQEPEAVSTKREFYEILQVRKYGFDPVLLGTFSTIQQAEKAVDCWRRDMPNQSIRIEQVTRTTVAKYQPPPRSELIQRQVPQVELAKQEVKP